MICKFCGNEIDDNAELCFICGQKVAPAAAQDPQPPADDPTAYILEEPQDPPKEAPRPAVAPVEAAGPAENSNQVVVNKPVKAGKFARFVSFLFLLIGLIIYAVKKKNGEEAKANSIANAIVAGLCLKMAVLAGYLVKLFMFS